jgi:hypothetical protein
MDKIKAEREQQKKQSSLNEANAIADKLEQLKNKFK